MKTLLIIPAYNEEANIERVVNNIRDNYQQYDYVVINDCSTDGTKQILEKISANYVDLDVNLGIGGAVQTGYIYADKHEYDVAIQIDGDGQHDPSHLKELIDPIEKGQANMTIGSRFINKEGFQSSALRRFGIGWLSMVIKLLTGVRVHDVTSGLRAVDKTLIKIYKKDYAQDFPEPEAIMLCNKVRGKIVEVPVIMHERAGGVSSINSLKSIYYMIKVTLALIVCKFKKI